jgi:hypothetical protein
MSTPATCFLNLISFVCRYFVSISKGKLFTVILFAVLPLRAGTAGLYNILMLLLAFTSRFFRSGTL